MTSVTLSEEAKVDCDKCLDEGFYFDDRCMEDVCAHAGKLKAVRDKDGNKTKVKKRVRVMPCPARVCSCPHGAEPRKQLKAKLEIQRERLATANASYR